MAKTLLQRLQEINAEGRQHMVDHPGSWVGMLTEDLNHWLGYGITTAEGLDRYLDAEAEHNSREWE